MVFADRPPLVAICASFFFCFLDVMCMGVLMVLATKPPLVAICVFFDYAACIAL